MIRYKKINMDTARSLINYSYVGVGEKLYGLYMRSFCQGLELILQPYRERLLSLEKELLTDPHLTAAYIQSQLEEYQLLFVALTSVTEQLEQHRVI